MQVMLNCILGMVEKTQSALTILQQRQSEAATLRTTEEAVADVQVCVHLILADTKFSAHLFGQQNKTSCSGSGEPGNPGGEAGGDGGDPSCERRSSST